MTEALMMVGTYTESLMMTEVLLTVTLTAYIGSSP